MAHQPLVSSRAPDRPGRSLPEAFERQRSTWLPTDSDRQYVASLMHPVREPRKIANWIAPPRRGIAKKPLGHTYVRRA